MEFIIITLTQDVTLCPTMCTCIRVLRVLHMLQGPSKPQWRQPVPWVWIWTCRLPRWLPSKGSNSLFFVLFLTFSRLLGPTQLSTHALDTPPHSLLMPIMFVWFMATLRWKQLALHLQVRYNTTQKYLFYIFIIYFRLWYLGSVLLHHRNQNSIDLFCNKQLCECSLPLRWQ